MINSLASTRENTDIKLLFLYRLGVLLFSIIMTLQGQIRGALLDQDWLVILCYGAFQVLVPLFFIAAIKARAFYLFAFADILDRKSTRLNSSHVRISYAVFCLK